MILLELTSTIPKMDDQLNIIVGISGGQQVIISINYQMK